MEATVACCQPDSARGRFAAGSLTDAIFYVVDSYKSQLQSGKPVAIRNMGRGLLSLSLLGNGPSLAFFFAAYSEVKQCKWVGDSASGVLLASLVCAVPASFIAVPGDTLKKRVVLGVDRTPMLALCNIVKTSGSSGLMVGWQANVAKDVPFAALKMSLYEGLLRAWAAASGKEVHQVGTDHREQSVSVLSNGSQ